MVIKHYLRLEVEYKGNSYGFRLEGKDKEGNNLTFMREVKIKHRGDEFFPDISGHAC